MGLGQSLARTGALRLRSMTRTADAYQFNGGINIMDSPSVVRPGQLLGCLNYEPGVRGGYRRWDGYERFDGQSSPTKSAYVALSTTTLIEPAVGTAVTETASGAQGTVAYVDAANTTLVLVDVTGAFVGNGSAITSAAGAATTRGTPFLSGGATTALTNEYNQQKFLYLQSFIGPVGGVDASGPVLGVVPYLADVYAIRNNVAGTAADLWQSSNTGWVKVSLGIKVRFDQGVYADAMQAPFEGTVLTGATSGATLIIRRINANTGTWGTDAAGYLVTASITGTPVPGEWMQAASANVLRYLSQADQTLPAGGVYKFRTFNFNAAQNPDSGFRLYGVNGVSNAFEYDAVGGTFVLIETGMADDAPTNLEVHASYLFFSFPGGSLQNSGFQLPLNWNPITGAGERSVGAEVTFLREDVSGTLIIGTRRNLWMLTGISAELFQIKLYANNGAIAMTDESPGTMVFMEDRGFTTVGASPKYGNFQSGSISDTILNLVVGLIEGDTAIGAVTTKSKNMYRLMFASGTVLCLGMNAKGQSGGWTSGSMVHKPHCFNGGFTQDAGVEKERLFMGGENGYVYEMDVGTSFDGQNITHFLRLAYNASRTPDLFKRYRRVQVDLQPEGTAALNISVDFDYGNRSGQAGQPLDMQGNGGFWDVALWDHFNWDGAQYTQASLKVDGEGYNIGLFFAGNSNNDASITVYGASLQWTARVINRNTGNQ